MKKYIKKHLNLNYCILFLGVFLISSFNSKLKAQSIDSTEIINLEIDSLNKVLVTLKDGGIVKGYFITFTKTEIKVNNELIGIVTIPYSNISKIKKIHYNDEVEVENNNYNNNSYNNNNPNNLNIVKFGGPVKNKYSNKNSNEEPQFYSHKYFMGNNYYGLKKKELVYQNLWVLYNGIDYGLTNNFSIGGGGLMMFVSGFVNFHLRGQFELNEYIKLGCAYNLFYVTGERSSSFSKTFGLFTGGVTIGNKFSNISLSMGKGDFKNNKPNSPANPDLNNYGYVISGMLKINKTTYVITDNFLLNKYDEKYFSLGFRFLGKNTAFDLGLMGNTYMYEGYGNYNQSTGNYEYNKTESVLAYPFMAFTYKIK